MSEFDNFAEDDDVDVSANPNENLDDVFGGDDSDDESSENVEEENLDGETFDPTTYLPNVPDDRVELMSTAIDEPVTYRSLKAVPKLRAPKMDAPKGKPKRTKLVKDIPYWADIVSSNAKKILSVAATVTFKARTEYNNSKDGKKQSRSEPMTADFSISKDLAKLIRYLHISAAESNYPTNGKDITSLSKDSDFWIAMRVIYSASKHAEAGKYLKLSDAWKTLSPETRNNFRYDPKKQIRTKLRTPDALEMWNTLTVIKEGWLDMIRGEFPEIDEDQETFIFSQSINYVPNSTSGAFSMKQGVYDEENDSLYYDGEIHPVGNRVFSLIINLHIAGLSGTFNTRHIKIKGQSFVYAEGTVAVGRGKTITNNIFEKKAEKNEE